MKPVSLLVFAAAILMAGAAQAQRPLLSTEVAADTLPQSFGPHRRHFHHFYVSYMPVVGAPAAGGAKYHPWATAEIVPIGYREKLRLTPRLAIGADVRYVHLRYSLVQNDAKVLPTNALHKTEWLTLHRLDLEGWARFRFGRQGNTVGRYLDVSGWGGWVAGTAHHTEDEPNTTGAKRVKVTETGLPYMRRWAYGVGGRLGSQRFALLARYRLSDTFRGSRASLYPELPRWVVGLEIGLL